MPFHLWCFCYAFNRLEDAIGSTYKELNWQMENFFRTYPEIWKGYYHLRSLQKPFDLTSHFFSSNNYGKINSNASIWFAIKGTIFHHSTLTLRLTNRKLGNNQLISRPSNTMFGYVPKGCSIIPQEHVLSYVHSSIICHRQNLETN